MWPQVPCLPRPPHLKALAGADSSGAHPAPAACGGAAGPRVGRRALDQRERAVCQALGGEAPAELRQPLAHLHGDSGGSGSEAPVLSTLPPGQSFELPTTHLAHAVAADGLAVDVAHRGQRQQRLCAACGRGGWVGWGAACHMCSGLAALPLASQQQHRHHLARQALTEGGCCGVGQQLAGAASSGGWGDGGGERSADASHAHARGGQHRQAAGAGWEWEGGSHCSACDKHPAPHACAAQTSINHPPTHPPKPTCRGPAGQR